MAARCLIFYPTALSESKWQAVKEKLYVFEGSAERVQSLASL